MSCCTTGQFFVESQVALAHHADGLTSTLDMSAMKPTTAKIIHHSEGLGTPTADTVRRRAQELAKINGHEEFNDDDWREAKRELHGGHEPNDTNGDMDMTAAVSEHDMVACSMGRHVENVGLEDQENVV